MSSQWYISRDGKAREGPFTQQQVRLMLRTGQLRPHMLGWAQGQEGWRGLGEIPDLADVPPPLPMKTIIDPETRTPPPPLAEAPMMTPALAPEIAPREWARAPQAQVAVAAEVAPPRAIQSTPLGSGEALPNAGFWLRLVAVVIDTIITGTMSACANYAVYFAWGLILRASDGKISIDEAMPFIIITVSLAAIAINWLYYAGLESSRRQATLGKLAMGLRVTDMNFARLRFKQATGRYFAKFVSAIILGVGFLMAAWTTRKQGLHDIMAETLVLRGAVSLDDR
jgi:uncharacterized RDD family membrane protein YckC